MQLNLELATSQLIVSAGFFQPVTSLRHSYGEGSRVEIHVTRDGVTVVPTELEEFAFIVKAKGLYAASAPILAGAPDFTWDSTISRWVAEIDYNVPALTTQLFLETTATDEQKYLELSAQLIWRVNSSAGQQRSQVIESFYLENTIWKGTETFPSTGTALESDSLPALTPVAVLLAADVVNNHATLNTITDITDLRAPVQSGVWYHFRAVIHYTAATLLTGARFSVTGPASPTALVYRSSVPLTPSTQKLNEGLTAYDLPAATGTDSLLTGNIAIVEGQLKPSADGFLQLRFASELSGSAITAKAGSCLHITRLS